MSTSLRALVLLMIAASTTAFATSGIAVSMHDDAASQAFCPAYQGEYPAGKIMRYNIVNDQVVSQQVLDTTHSGGRWATLNISGTKCAFFRCTIKSGNAGVDKWYVSVVDIDGKNLRNLVDLTALGYDGWGYMDWPKGDYIYFSCGYGDDEAGTPGTKKFYRVKETTSSVELVKTLDYATWVWNLSANGDRATIRTGSLDVTHCVNEILKMPFPPASTSCTSPALELDMGCTNAMSPSGNLISYTTDAGHAAFNIALYDTKSNVAVIDWTQYNLWAVNCASIKQTCGSQVYTVGDGCNENRYSVNSDKWMCYHIGWANSILGGRFLNCGANQVLVNWQDRKTIMVSFNPRFCGSGESAENARCSSPTPPGATVMRQEAGDFIVTAPDSEINADLRSYIQNQRPTTFKPLSAQASVNTTNSEALFSFENSAPHTIRIYSLAGALVRARTGQGAAEKISFRGLARGSYRAVVTQGTITQTAVVRNW